MVTGVTEVTSSKKGLGWDFGGLADGFEKVIRKNLYHATNSMGVSLN